MQTFKQFRYFGENSEKNSLNDNGERINGNTLVSGNFFNNSQSLTQLGVRALPGTKFYINALPNDNSHPVIVGYLGIFELDFSNGGAITSLRFDQKSIDAINSNLQGGYIIIDMLIKGGANS